MQLPLQFLGIPAGNPPFFIPLNRPSTHHQRSNPRLQRIKVVCLTCLDMRGHA